MVSFCITTTNNPCMFLRLSDSAERKRTSFSQVGQASVHPHPPKEQDFARLSLSLSLSYAARLSLLVIEPQAESCLRCPYLLAALCVCVCVWKRLRRLLHLSLRYHRLQDKFVFPVPPTWSWDVPIPPHRSIHYLIRLSTGQRFLYLRQMHQWSQPVYIAPPPPVRLG